MALLDPCRGLGAIGGDSFQQLCAVKRHVNSVVCVAKDRILTLSSAALAFNKANSISRSPSPFAVKAARISCMVGGTRCCDAVSTGERIVRVMVSYLFEALQRRGYECMRRRVAGVVVAEDILGVAGLGY